MLLCLSAGDRRFSDLRVALPVISANVLTQRMRDLETAGLVERRWLPPPAASQVYALAPLADTLRPALAHLATWRASPSPLKADSPCRRQAENAPTDSSTIGARYPTHHRP